MEQKTLRSYMVGMLLLALFLLLILSGFEVEPVTNGSDDLLIEQQASLQIVRGEYIENQVLAMKYRDNQALEIGDLQATLPSFEQVQSGILHGNAAFGLPGNPPDSVKAVMANQGDYANIVSAINRILATPDTPPDMVQVNIVVQHTQPYAIQMYQVASLLQQDAETRRFQILLIKLGLIGAASVSVILKYTVFTRAALVKLENTTCKDV